MYVFDLDGTLADCTHRLKYIQQETKDWDKFHSTCTEDMPIEYTIDTLNHLAQSEDITILTGRNDVVRAETIAWLEKHDVHYTWLKMRKGNDRRQDHVIKRAWLENFRLANPDGDIIGVFEDRQQVVDMWREEGLICYQVAPGNF